MRPQSQLTSVLETLDKLYKEWRTDYIKVYNEMKQDVAFLINQQGGDSSTFPTLEGYNAKERESYRADLPKVRRGFGSYRTF